MGACGLDMGGCGAEGPFEGVFHEDLLDKPDWKAECLQPQTWEAAMQQLRAPCGDGEMHGGQWAGLSWSSCPQGTKSLAWPCTAVPLSPAAQALTPPSRPAQDSSVRHCLGQIKSWHLLPASLTP